MLSMARQLSATPILSVPVVQCTSRTHNRLGPLWSGGSNFDVAEVLISGLRITEATFSGIQIRGDHIVRGVVLENTTIARSTTYGVEVRSNARGRYDIMILVLCFHALIEESMRIPIRVHP